jgi:hypothetical protein
MNTKNQQGQDKLIVHNLLVLDYAKLNCKSLQSLLKSNWKLLCMCKLLV